MERKTAEITTEQIKELRARTGAGIVDCRNALQQAGGDLDKAAEILKAKGLATAQKKAGRAATEGLIEAYIHTGGKVGAMVEVNCETDFVARTDEFRRLSRDLAMQITASAPRYGMREEIRAETVEEQRRLFASDLAGKPAAAVEGKLTKWYQEVVLLEQPFIRDESKTVRDLIPWAVA